MTLYLDRHDLGPGDDVTPEEVATAHLRDLEVQARHGVRYISYWFDPGTQLAFCLADAPSKEAAEAVHREAHGLVANRIIEVDPRRIEEFFGHIEEPAPGEPRAESALRAILFTDMEGSTALSQRLGDDVAMEALHTHDGIVGGCLESSDGRKVKHTGDGVMACFASVVKALECAAQIQRALTDHNEGGAGPPIRVRVGLSAGEPVSANEDLYGAAVNLAARICALCEPTKVLASSAVKELAIGKPFTWEDRGETPIRGFDEPVRLYELRW